MSEISVILSSVPVLGLVVCATLVSAVAPAEPRGDELYVVTLDRPPNGDTAKARRQAMKLTEEYGGRLRRVYSSALRGFSVSMGPSQAAELARDRRVSLVEVNRVFQSQAETSWGLDRVNQRALPLDGKPVSGLSASGVTVYVVDSGLRVSHAEFGQRAAHGYDAIDDDLVTQDCLGHGTHVAGTIGGSTYGVAPDVALVGVRVLDCEGKGTTADVLAGLDWVTKNARRPAVVNMSLHSGRSRAIDTAVRNSIRTGLPYVVAAGNGADDACLGSPSSTPEAITVGASTRTDEAASYSDGGPCVDLYAPGSVIRSAWGTDDEAVADASGTSMAAPHVTGVVAALMAGRPKTTPEDLAHEVVTNASPGVLKGLGSGSPNRLLYQADQPATQR